MGLRAKKKTKTETNKQTNKKKKTEEFSREEYRMAEKHLKKCSAPLITREMQIKTALRFHLIPVRMGMIKNSGDSICWQECRERNTPPLLVVLQACTTTLEISLVVPQKIGHSTA